MPCTPSQPKRFRLQFELEHPQDKWDQCNPHTELISVTEKVITYVAAMCFNNKLLSENFTGVFSGICLNLTSLKCLFF